MACSCDDIARMIDHSLLRPDLTQEDVHKGCEVARKYNVSDGGAILADLQLMHQSISEKVPVKAAGGARDVEMALKESQRSWLCAIWRHPNRDHYGAVLPEELSRMNQGVCALRKYLISM